MPGLARFRTGYPSPQAKSAVQRDAQEGYALGIPSTPAFLINGRPVLGAQPLQQFEQAIDDALRHPMATPSPSGSGR